jgi:hypothetical protein
MKRKKLKKQKNSYYNLPHKKERPLLLLREIQKLKIMARLLFPLNLQLPHLPIMKKAQILKTYKPSF